VQYPEAVEGMPEFLPDFTRDAPFEGNKTV
jgi:hypothetical protein